VAHPDYGAVGGPLKSEFIPQQSAPKVRSARPIVGLKDEYPAGWVDPPHTHDRTQLLYACSGVMSAITSRCIYAVPPQRCLWIDAGISHEVACRSNVSVRTLYIDPKLHGDKAVGCRLLDVSPFLQALILEVVEFDTGKPMDERERLITELLLHEIWHMPDAPWKVAMPQDRRLRHACQLITENPDSQADLDELAQVACMSRRAFTRLFRQETGTSFGDWRRQMRLAEALSLLESGESVTRTAYEVGYSSPSAFSAAFHRVFGISPSQYQEPRARE